MLHPATNLLCSKTKHYRSFRFKLVKTQAIIINPIPVRIGGSINLSPKSPPTKIITTPNKTSKNCAVAKTEFRFIV